MRSAPAAGEYGLEIYVGDAGVDDSSFSPLCQYLIVCTELDGVAQMRTRLPRVPPGFLGPQPSCRKFGLQCTSHDDPYIVAPSAELEVSKWLV